MSARKLIIVHGMGQHTSESFKKEVLDSLSMAFGLYSRLKSKKPEDYVEIVSVGYNHIFDEVRERMSQQGQSLRDRLSVIDGMTDALLTDAIHWMSDVESEIGDDDFYKTHWLDVLLYRYTLLGERVRIELGEAISKAVAYTNGGSQNVHILGHSLGTAVVHDTLAKLYDSSMSLKNIDNLLVNAHKLGSVHMVANTSRVLESFVNVSRSLVHPGDGGVTRFYREYRHKLDPITWAKSFNPTDNGGWISVDSMYLKRYALAELSSLTNQHGHTHSIQHYLANPWCHQELFKKVLGINLTPEENEEGHFNYIDMTLSDKAAELEDAISKLKELNLESVKGVITAAKVLKDFVEKAGGQF